MLSQKMVENLNKQVQLEMYSSNLYLAMSSWCAHKCLNSTAAFLKAHSKEDLSHAYKLFDYINETGAFAVINKVQKPNTNFSTLNFLQWYTSEQHGEKKLFKDILDKIDIIGIDGRGLYHLDKEIGSIQKSV